MTDRYTKVPRSTLWLLREGSLRVGGAELDVAPFYVGKSLVTNAEYEAFDPAHARCEASRGDDDPVVNVSFIEASAYCGWYAALSKKPFRLPTELEWEYGCRAGKAHRFCWGDDPSASAAFAWTAESSAGRAHAVESLRANAFGLHDTLGLAWEWTSGLFAEPLGAEGARRSPATSGPRALRGGSFRTPLTELGCGVRREAPEDLRADDVGFRIARSL